MIIRPEREEDFNAIHELNLLACGGEDKARLIRRIRRPAEFIPELSLVAEKEGGVDGHILFNPIIVETKKGKNDP